MEQSLLKVENISAAYGGIKALNNVSIEISRGRIVSVLGSNGAGKKVIQRF